MTTAVNTAIRVGSFGYYDAYELRAKLMVAVGDTADLDSQYGEKFLERRVDQMARELSAYSRFWLERKENEEAALGASKYALTLSPQDFYQRFNLAG